MNNTLKKIILSSLFSFSVLANTAAAETVVATEVKTDKKAAEGSDKTYEAKAKEEGAVADDMKEVSFKAPAIKADDIKLGMGFRTTGFLVVADSRQEIINTPAGIGLKKLDSQTYSTVVPVAAIKASIDKDNYRGVITLEGRVNKDDANSVDSKSRANGAIYFDETYVNLGSRDGFNMDIGICDSAAAYIFKGNSTYYRGPDKGVFGDAMRVARWKNAVDGKIFNGNKDNKDEGNIQNPMNTYYLRDTLSGDDWTLQPRVTLWAPKIISNDKKHVAEFGISSTISDQTANGLFLTAGAYYDYLFSADKSMRLSFGGGVSTMTKEDLKDINMNRPGGIVGGISYHSKDFDAGLKLVYNFKTYTRNFEDEKMQKATSTVSFFDLNTPSASPVVKTFSFAQDDQTGPFVAALRVRIGLAHDYDLTLGAITSIRDTGVTLDSKSIKDTSIAASIGVNGPISNMPFRWGVEFTGMWNDIDTNSSDVNTLERMASTTKNEYVNNKHMFMLSAGITYAPKA